MQKLAIAIQLVNGPTRENVFAYATKVSSPRSVTLTRHNENNLLLPTKIASTSSEMEYTRVRCHQVCFVVNFILCCQVCWHVTPTSLL